MSGLFVRNRDGMEREEKREKGERKGRRVLGITNSANLLLECGSIPSLLLFGCLISIEGEQLILGKTGISRELIKNNNILVTLSFAIEEIQSTPHYNYK